MSEPTRTMLAEVVLDLPPHLAAVAGERIALVIRTLCDTGLPVEANAERLATMRERLAAAIMRTVRMTGPAKIGIAYRLVDVLVAMESAGLCVTCAADLPARFTLSGSAGWGRCASCPGPCDATHERCNRRSGHKETCSPHPDRVQLVEIDLEHGKDVDGLAALRPPAPPAVRCPTPGCAGPGPDWADQGPDPGAAIPIACTGCGAHPEQEGNQ